jgi:hypothetical protein
LEGEKRLG